MDSLGLRLVRSLIEEKRLDIVTEVGISANDLFESSREAFNWVNDYVARSLAWPSASIVEENVGVTFADTVDPLWYIADVVRKRTLSKQLEHELKSAVDLLDGRDPDEVVSRMLEAGMKLKKHTFGTKLASYRGSALSRIAAYEKLKSSGTLDGVKTRWPTLNTCIQGWCNGTLNVITAKANTGKTWMACVIADDCMRMGKKVLFVTMEMPEGRIQRRLDAVRYKIPFGLLRDVSMDDITEERWKELLKGDVEGAGDILIADKRLVQRVGDVRALVMQHRPDVVIIDGGYRFKGTSRRDNMWADTVEIVGDLQDAAEMTMIPWIVTTQQGDSSDTGKEVRKGPKMAMWNIRYGKEWVINPDVVVGLYANADLRALHQAELYMLKIREGVGEHVESMRIWWDQTTMNYDEVLAERPEGGLMTPAYEIASGSSDIVAF